MDCGGHVHSTFPEGVPGIGADPVSFRGRESVRFKVWTLDPAGAPPPDSLARPVVLPAFLDLATPL